MTVGGLAVTLLGRHQRIAVAVGGAALVTASACTRIGVFEAGTQSADDPKYVVEPQRQRLTAQT